MRIFLTGATGYIGGAVAAALRQHGHEVAALVRPESEAKHLRDLGIVLISGDLDTLPSLSDTLANYDCFVHTAKAATDHVEADLAAVDTFTALARPFIYTSGVWVLGNTDSADESSPVNPLPIVAWRPAHEERVIAAGGAVVRPGCVYGGKQSLLAGWFAAAEQNQPLQIVGEGRNRWAMIDLHEMADGYARIVDEHARGVFHLIDDTSATLEECARATAPDAPIQKTPLDDARATMGNFADALAVDQRISSIETRAKLSWIPRRTYVNSIAEQWREWRASGAAGS